MRGSAALQPSEIYHICSRGNNREDIFITSHDRDRFLELYEVHVTPGADTFAYCLLPNHFHILLRFSEIEHWPSSDPGLSPSRRISNLLNAYARTFNSDRGRVGALFQRPFRRVLVQTQTQLLYVLSYIHLNPQRHGHVDDFRKWRYSSLAAIQSAGPTLLARDEVLSWFGGRTAFLAAHRSLPVDSAESILRLDDDSDGTT